MSESAGLLLKDNDDAPLVAAGAHASTRGDLARLASELAITLRQRGASRVLVRSDDPVHIIRAIEGCHRAGVDLFVCHTTVSEELVEEICDEHGVQAVLGALDSWRSARPDLPEGNRVFMMTSGTTGRPKIAAHTLETLFARARAGGSGRPQEGARWLLTYQPTGFAGVQVILTAALGHGLIVVPEQRNPAGFYEAARRWGVSQISGTPTFWRSFLMVARPNELPLQQITLGGEAADQTILDRIMAAYPSARVTHTYASTEAGVVYAVHDGREGFPAEWLEQPRPHVSLRIRDGFLQIKTDSSMRGYVGETVQPLGDDGWLSTADRVEINGDRVRVLGRDDTTINVGGSKVYPLAVEAFLLRQPGVAEARVYGAPNPISGFLVAADVVLADGRDAKTARQEILAACRAELPPYQAPRIFRIVDAIEVKASGKKG